MKKVISVWAAILVLSTAAFAQKEQDKKSGKQNDWRERVRAEQVAFITTELDLTEAEAQAFWPVYNEVQASRRQAFKASGEAFKALQAGAESDKADALLDAYIKSKKAAESIETDALARYKKVLPVSKVAKLALAEEKFRHQQIGKLGGREEGKRPGGPAARRPHGGEKPSRQAE